MIEYRDIHKAFDVPVLSGVSLTVADGRDPRHRRPVGHRQERAAQDHHRPHRARPGRRAARRRVGGRRAPREKLQEIRRQVGLRLPERRALRLHERLRERRLRPPGRGSRRTLGKQEVLPRVVAALEDVNLDPAVVHAQAARRSCRAACASAWAWPARSWASREILLYDEPVTGLDPVNAAAVDRLIKQIGGRKGVTSIVVTHDIEGGLPLSRPRRAAGGRAAALHRARPQEFRSSENPLVRAFADREAAAAAAAPLMQERRAIHERRETRRDRRRPRRHRPRAARARPRGSACS